LHLRGSLGSGSGRLQTSYWVLERIAIDEKKVVRADSIRDWGSTWRSSDSTDVGVSQPLWLRREEWATQENWEARPDNLSP